MGDNGHNTIIYNTNVIAWLWRRYSILSKGMNDNKIPKKRIIARLSRRLGKDCYYRLKPDEIDLALSILTSTSTVQVDEAIFYEAIEGEKNGHKKYYP